MVPGGTCHFVAFRDHHRADAARDSADRRALPSPAMPPTTAPRPRADAALS